MQYPETSGETGNQREWAVGGYQPLPLLLALLVLEGIMLFFLLLPHAGGPGLSPEERLWLGMQRETADTVIPRLSEMDGPAIDGGAVMAVAEDASLQPQRPCQTLPIALWAFLLLSYGLLLIFNFSYSFQTLGRITWKPEAAYTALFLLGWYVWDSCHATWWFPWLVLKIGILLFLIALFASEARKKAENVSADQEKLPF